MKKTLLSIILFTCCKLMAWEKNYTFHSMSQFYSHYSIINSTVGDGLVSAGNEKDAGAFNAHAMKTDYNGNITWSRTYSYSTLWTTHCYRIANDFNQGYIMTGMNLKNGTTNIFAPYVIKIDENGNPFRKVQLPVNGIGLTVRVCQNGNIIVGGFESETISDYASSTRVGFLCKLDANLNLLWYKRIMGQNISGYNNFDHVEAVLPIIMNGNEYYYVTGGITKDISGPGFTKTNIVMLSQLYDFNGNLIWNNSQGEDFNGVDAAFNPALNEIYLLSNGNKNTPWVSNFYRIDALTGNIMLYKSFEGSVGASPYGCHITYSNKINFQNNKIYIYGHSRDYYRGTIYNNHYFPFRIVTDRDFNSPTNTLYMVNGLNYSLGGIMGTHGTGNFHSFHTADMGVDFIKEGQEHFALLGYDNFLNNNTYSIHIAYDPVIGDCTPRNSAIDYGDMGAYPILSPGHLNIPKPNPPPLTPLAADLNIIPDMCTYWVDPPLEGPNNSSSATDGSEKTHININNKVLSFTMAPEQASDYSIAIYNQVGQLVYKGSGSSSVRVYDIPLSPGFYIVEIRNGSNVATHPFIQ